MLADIGDMRTSFLAEARRTSFQLDVMSHCNAEACTEMHFLTHRPFHVLLSTRKSKGAN